jgi:hexosaminidase
VISVVPAPARIVAGEGAFALDGATVSGPLAEDAAGVLGVPVGPGAITLALAPGHGAEGHRLVVHPSGIRLTADADEGLFRGLQTLRQLIADRTVPAVTIDDAPRFAYRGAMLDLARHFFGVDDI